MITPHELFCVLLVPLLVASGLALGARITGRHWVYPVAVGAAFLTGYSLLGTPSLPPRDGTDWLFWLAIPLTLLGVLESHRKPRLVSWLAGLGAMLAAFLVAWPLRKAIGPVPFALTCICFAVVAVVLVTLLDRAGDQVGFLPITLGLCGVAGGVAVLILSSNVRILGVYGLATASAIGPVAVIGGFRRRATVSAATKNKPRAGGVATLGVGLLVAELVGGHLYAEPGATWIQIALMLLALAVLAGVSMLPVGKPALRAILALIATAGLVGAVVAPAALAAKKAAADDPYAEQK